VSCIATSINAMRYEGNESNDCHAKYVLIRFIRGNSMVGLPFFFFFFFFLVKIINSNISFSFHANKLKKNPN
jgi:hypothetical protein